MRPRRAEAEQLPMLYLVLFLEVCPCTLFRIQSDRFLLEIMTGCFNKWRGRRGTLDALTFASYVARSDTIDWNDNETLHECYECYDSLSVHVDVLDSCRSRMH